jgi:hypothetical protein
MRSGAAASGEGRRRCEGKPRCDAMSGSPARGRKGATQQRCDQRRSAAAGTGAGHPRSDDEPGQHHVAEASCVREKKQDQG